MDAVQVGNPQLSWKAQMKQQHNDLDPSWSGCWSRFYCLVGA